MQDKHVYEDEKTGRVFIYEDDPLGYLKAKYNYRASPSARLKIFISRLLRRVVDRS